jgi:cytoskeletal protein CcmA (bactofilin family)
MAEVRIKDIDEHEIDTILAEDIDFEGHLTFRKPLMIKGKFKGEIKSTSALYIGEKAYVEAATEADVVSSKGRHKGNILGRSRVELYSTARVDGDIATPDFVMESGCKFNGYCNMSGEQGKKEPAAGSPPSAAGAAAPGASTPVSHATGAAAPGVSTPGRAAQAPGGAPQQQKPVPQQGGAGPQGPSNQPTGGQK